MGQTNISKEDEQEEMVDLAKSMYTISYNFLKEIMNFEWMTEKNQIAILGGIMINCEGEGTDVFQPLMFEVKTKDKTIDIFDCFSDQKRQ